MGRQRTTPPSLWSDLARRCSRAAAEEADRVSEFAREVGTTTAAHLRRANRSARKMTGDVEAELYDLGREIADLARGAQRARAERRRKN